MKYTIKDLAEGRVAVKNDGTLEELREVLRLAFPLCDSIPAGDGEIYSLMDCSNIKSWGSGMDSSLPIQSVKYFRTTQNNPIQPEHYVKGEIQPIDFIEANNLDFFEGCVVKYVARYKHKNGLEDLKKAQVYLQRLIDRYESN